MANLKDKVVVITGAAGVICAEFAKELARCGAKVALLGRTAESLEKLADQIGKNALPIKVDCLSKEELILAKEKVNAKWGKVNVLINGVGGNNPVATTEIEQMTPDCTAERNFFAIAESGFESVFNTNIFSAFIASQVFATDMIEGGGNIINISSMSAYRALTKTPAYSAAKAGISNLTQWLAVHFAPCNIRCNAIAPGFFLTKQNRDLMFNKDGTPTERMSKVIKATPMGRFGEVSELLGTLVWLVDDEKSKFVTGVVVPVDGGFSAYSGV